MDNRSTDKNLEREMQKNSRQQHHNNGTKEKQTNVSRVKGSKNVTKEKSSCSTKQPSFIRTASTPTKTPAIGEAKVPKTSTPVGNMTPDLKLGFRTDTVKHLPIKCIQREFTFTGYDIMADGRYIKFLHCLHSVK